nr:class I SAM-dependent methyltransferase [uncultured Neokomagataea sp.]
MPASYTPHDQKIIDQFTRWAKPFAELPIHAEADSLREVITACNITEASTVLDVACGPGIVACALAQEGACVTGIDLTPRMIAQAHDRAVKNNVTVNFQVGDARSLPFKDSSFDRVVTRYSFHHMENPREVLAEMIRVCRPNGRLIVIDATPAPAAQQGYDQAEKLRDASHTSALTLTQLLSLGNDAGLSHILTNQYRLESRLEDQVAPEDWSALKAIFLEDIRCGLDRLGMGAWQAEDGIRFHFPISIVSWSKPSNMY